MTHHAGLIDVNSRPGESLSYTLFKYLIILAWVYLPAALITNMACQVLLKGVHVFTLSIVVLNLSTDWT